MIKFLLFATLSCSLVWAQNRGSYLYENGFTSLGMDYADLLADKKNDRLEELSEDKRSVCIKRYQELLKDQILDIRIPLGYFDWTTGAEVISEGSNYGFSPSLDLGIFYALQNLLLTPCSGRLRFCGFKRDRQNSLLLVKNINIHGQNTQVLISMHHASITELLAINLYDKRKQQMENTSFMDDFFTDSLKNADAVFYLGHSRNGGGPDFAPPVFVPGKNKVDYKGYYQVRKPGLNKMLRALNGSTPKTPVIGLMSCASREHFLQMLRKIAPNSGVISSRDVLTVDHVFTATIGAIDALLRGQCQKSFYQSIRMTEENQAYITMDGMFE